MGKNVYSSEAKWVVVKGELSGELTNIKMMEKYGIVLSFSRKINSLKFLIF